MEYVLGYLKKAGFNNKELLEIKSRLLITTLERSFDCEYLSYKQVINKLNRGSMRIEDGCLEKKCSCCREFFPYNLEFFWSEGKSGAIRSKCKACYAEIKSQNKTLKPIILGKPKRSQ